jgi:hypothetical protein
VRKIRAEGEKSEAEAKSLRDEKKISSLKKVSETEEVSETKNFPGVKKSLRQKIFQVWKSLLDKKFTETKKKKSPKQKFFQN